MWIHLETFHMIHEPTYMSKYQPAQGFFLAVGQVLSGYPIVGVWLAMALMSAAVCWMLQAWLTPRWALLGGLLTIIHPYIGAGGYWAQSYWGGAVPALGGALLLGSWRHLQRQPRTCIALTGALGLMIMANSRPYEGLVLFVPVALGLLTWLMGTRKPPLGVAVRNVVLPFAFVGIVAFSFMGYYNYRVAGNVFRLPYQVHEKAYDMFAYFVWQNLPPEPAYRHSVIREFHADYELPHYVGKQTLKGFVSTNFAVFMMCLLLIGSVFLVPVVGSARALMAWCWKDRWGRRAILTYVVFALGLSLETVMSLHYWAPITALTYYFILQGMRLWRAQNPRIGRLVLYAIPALAAAVFVINVVQSRVDPLDWSRQRARLLNQLKQQPGQHLVLVKYGPQHFYEFEWVYNEADIDGSKVVWARAMDLKEDCKLVEYFKDRTIWMLEIDDDKALIQPKIFPKESCR